MDTKNYYLPLFSTMPSKKKKQKKWLKVASIKFSYFENLTKDQFPFHLATTEDTCQYIFLCL